MTRSSPYRQSAVPLPRPRRPRTPWLMRLRVVLLLAALMWTAVRVDVPEVARAGRPVHVVDWLAAAVIAEAFVLVYIRKRGREA